MNSKRPRGATAARSETAACSFNTRKKRSTAFAETCRGGGPAFCTGLEVSMSNFEENVLDWLKAFLALAIFFGFLHLLGALDLILN